MSLFRKLEMILIMKTNSINQKIILKCSPHQYWNAWKKLDTYKNISLTFKCLNLFFNLPQNLGTIQVHASTFLKYDYNNLAFEVHANKSLM